MNWLRDDPRFYPQVDELSFDAAISTKTALGRSCPFHSRTFGGYLHLVSAGLIRGPRPARSANMCSGIGRRGCSTGRHADLFQREGFRKGATVRETGILATAYTTPEVWRYAFFRWMQVEEPYWNSDDGNR